MHAADYQGRLMPVGVNSLVKRLRYNEHRDDDNKSINSQDTEKKHLKFFEPIFLNASKWNPNNAF